MDILVLYTNTMQVQVVEVDALHLQLAFYPIVYLIVSGIDAIYKIHNKVLHITDTV